jgi:hypothetical protein
MLAALPSSALVRRIGGAGHETMVQIQGRLSEILDLPGSSNVVQSIDDFEDRKGQIWRMIDSTEILIVSNRTYSSLVPS